MSDEELNKELKELSNRLLKIADQYQENYYSDRMIPILKDFLEKHFEIKKHQ